MLIFLASSPPASKWKRIRVPEGEVDNPLILLISGSAINFWQETVHGMCSDLVHPFQLRLTCRNTFRDMTNRDLGSVSRAARLFTQQFSQTSRLTTRSSCSTLLSLLQIDMKQVRPTNKKLMNRCFARSSNQILSLRLSKRRAPPSIGPWDFPRPQLE